MKLSLSSVVVATTDQLSTELGGEAVILHMGRGVYFGLDEVGTRVWSLVQTPRRVSEVCAALENEYDVDAKRCQDAVFTLLSEMSDAGLIEIADAPAA